MKQEPLHIDNFEIGDIIVRMEPAKQMEGSRKNRDRSYIGKPFKFLGVANGCIYVEKQKVEGENDQSFPEMEEFNLAEMLSFLTGDRGPQSLPLDLWDEGWALYIDPYSIGDTEEAATEFMKGANFVKLKKELKKALENEEYELADKIQAKINRWNKK